MSHKKFEFYYEKNNALKANKGLGKPLPWKGDVKKANKVERKLHGRNPLLW